MTRRRLVLRKPLGMNQDEGHGAAAYLSFSFTAVSSQLSAFGFWLLAFGFWLLADS
jgi:hypothetical protein